MPTTPIDGVMLESTISNANNIYCYPCSRSHCCFRSVQS